jgi:hypothetical protein
MKIKYDLVFTGSYKVHIDYPRNLLSIIVEILVIKVNKPRKCHLMSELEETVQPKEHFRDKILK